MLCARVVRGAASSAKLVKPAAERIEHADQRGTGLHQREFVGRGSLHLQHQLGTERGGPVDDLRTDRLEGGIGRAGRDTGASTAGTPTAGTATRDLARA